jgi:hypothetical protein
VKWTAWLSMGHFRRRKRPIYVNFQRFQSASNKMAGFQVKRFLRLLVLAKSGLAGRREEEGKGKERKGRG